MDIDKIVSNLLAKYPLFGNTIAKLSFIYDKDEKRAPAYTDGKNVYYTSLFFMFDDDEKLFTLAHELLHIEFNHIFRNPKRDHDLLNYVADGIINQLLIKDGLKMPDGLVNIPDALNYSVEELYMKYIYLLDQIKKYMQEHTVHISFGIEDEENKNGNSSGSAEEVENSNNKKKKKDDTGSMLRKIMYENKQIRETLLNEFAKQMQSNSWGNMEGNFSAKLKSVGHNDSDINWKELLEASLTSQSLSKTLYYEVELDGIIRKIKQEEKDISDTEVIIDSSGSMPDGFIKVILSECKRILHDSSLKIRFCDTKNYEWNEICCDEDIDNITVRGRGGTNFSEMAEGFSNDAINKIVITDGYCEYPDECDDILWVIIETWYSPYLNKGKIPPWINNIIVKAEDLKNDIIRYRKK